MSRHCELFAGGNNGFEIKDIEGYKKWKSNINKDFQELLHEKKDGGNLTVYIGIRWKKEDLDELDTYLNHFHPDGDGWDSGTPAEFWCGLSLFVKEPIELFQTDEEFPFLSKVFGYEGDEDRMMYRIWAYEGKLIVQNLGFKILSKEEYHAKDLLDEEILSFVKSKENFFCAKCKTQLNLPKFNFETRGYYKQVKEKTGYKHLCEKCYTELKKPFADIKKLEEAIQTKQKELEKLKGGNGDIRHTIL